MGGVQSSSKRGGQGDDDGCTKEILHRKKFIVRPFQDVYEYDAISKILSEADVSDIEAKYLASKLIEDNIDNIDLENMTIPTVFKWQGGGKDVFLSGSFNQWKAKIPMVKSEHNFYTIVELPKGEHKYKFIIDGVWKIDYKQNIDTDDSGAKNNVIYVKSSDFDVLEALKEDIANSKHSSSNTSKSDRSKSPFRSKEPKYKDNVDNDNLSLSRSPPGSYCQDLPYKSILSDLGNDKAPTPPLLPPQLLQVILNKETGVFCDPNILPQPNHVMINHMYALSIKDGVIVLSAIARYRQKFVSTVMYKPI